MRTRWSQNFLIDKNIAHKCVDALRLEKDDRVLEIGAGKGILTKILLEKANKVIAVEIDPSLCEFLSNRFGHHKHFTLLQKDFLNVPRNRTPLFKSNCFKIIGNLPYAVVSPIIQKILEWRGWTTAVVMVQKEVGERIVSAPGRKDYGILSVSVQARCHVEKICLVSRHCFQPAPKIESAVLRLFPFPKPIFDPKKEKQFFAVVRAGFAHRRKTVLNSLTRSLDLPMIRIKNGIEKCGLSPNARAETFSPADFKRLSEMLYNSHLRSDFKNASS